MASVKAYTVGRLVSLVTKSTYGTLRASLPRCARPYSTEQKAADSANEQADKPASIEECHKQIEILTADVSKMKEQLKDYDDKYKRALADAENTRRRMTKQVEDAKSFAIQSFCKDLLDIADTLAAAAESVPEGGAAGEADAALRSLHDGVRLTKAQLTQVFTRHGLVCVSPLREKFDPNLHEALFQQEVEGAEPGTVVAVSKVGYKLHERCVRPALVGVAK
ncbi:hypothetical protein JYU34_017946 [Plutella xylostella]|uniref:GrpE protein homolog n=1 Tax=Plutella xylostella TaxID=51655 RepID=A0ABQ7Q359_PLUXY|nr:grpE protein homolog, mitochondrial [Plutella xylostella]KAG7298343.1 hypothetical protein JYU34_017946 [Plutella xylostella]